VAISTNNGQNDGPRRRRRGYTGAISEINVTPFVDVMLVLLIIFMITAHVMEFGMEVEVPKVRNVKETAQDLTVINVTKDARLFLNEKPVNINELVAQVQQRIGRNRQVYLRADKETPWNNVAQVMNELTTATPPIGINAVTQPDEDAGKPGR
jgi:biopolymer transport protein ExbD